MCVPTRVTKLWHSGETEGGGGGGNALENISVCVFNASTSLIVPEVTSWQSPVKIKITQPFQARDTVGCILRN
jgi:hypothetical protein